MEKDCQEQSEKEKTMEDVKFRNLKADEISVRCASVNEKGVSLLLYKDARVDTNILNETFGPLGWKNEFKNFENFEIKKYGKTENIFSCKCVISVKGEDGEWISKEDYGTESFSEPIKGTASDAFKRAGYKWGIGVELYNAPFIWVPADKTTIVPKNNSSGYDVRDSFSVKEITTDCDKVITHLIITNRKGEIVYTFGESKAAKTASTEAAEEKKASEKQIKMLLDLMDEYANLAGKNPEDLKNSAKKKYGAIENISSKDISGLIKNLKKSIEEKTAA